MGKKSTEIQHDLERQRHAVEARIQRLRRRIDEDVTTAKDEAKSDLDRAVGRESTVAEHPKALLAGSAVTGVVLGMLSESVRVPRPHLGRNGRGPDEAQEQQPSEREKRGLTALATTAAVGSVQGQINDLLAEAWEAFKSGFVGKSKVNDPSRLPPDVRGQPRGSGASRGSAAIAGGSAAAHGTRHLSREEISPDAVDADMALEPGEKSSREILHEARAEDYSPREDLPAYSGVQGEGLLMPRTPGVQAPYEEDERSERRTGQ